MIDTISKILAIVLAFLMLVVAPLLYSYKLDEAQARRAVLLDVTEFIDRVRDSRTVSNADLDTLYAKVNSHGIVVDCSVKRLVKYIDGAGDISYFANSDVAALNSFSKGDGIQVFIREITISAARQFVWRILGADSGSFELELAGVVG